MTLTVLNDNNHLFILINISFRSSSLYNKFYLWDCSVFYKTMETFLTTMVGMRRNIFVLYEIIIFVNKEKIRQMNKYLYWYEICAQLILESNFVSKNEQIVFNLLSDKIHYDLKGFQSTKLMPAIQSQEIHLLHVA